MPKKDAVQINTRVSEPDAARFEELSSILGASKSETFLWLLELVRYFPDGQVRWLVEESKRLGVYPGRLVADLVGEARARRNALAHGAQKMTKADAKRATNALMDVLDLGFLE